MTSKLVVVEDGRGGANESVGGQEEEAGASSVDVDGDGGSVEAEDGFGSEEWKEGPGGVGDWGRQNWRKAGERDLAIIFKWTQLTSHITRYKLSNDFLPP